MAGPNANRPMVAEFLGSARLGPTDAKLHQASTAELRVSAVTMRQRTAGIVGFIVAPLIAALIFSATTPLVRPQDVLSRIEMLPMAFLPAAGVTILIALPAFLLFKHFGLVRWWSVIGIGSVIGALIGCTLGSRNLAQVPGILFMAGTGAVSALGFWLIWIRGRQDDTTPH